MPSVETLVQWALTAVVAYGTVWAKSMVHATEISALKEDVRALKRKVFGMDGKGGGDGA